MSDKKDFGVPPAIRQHEDNGPLAALGADAKEVALFAQETLKAVRGTVSAVVGSMAGTVPKVSRQPIEGVEPSMPTCDPCIVLDIRREHAQTLRDLGEIAELIQLL